VAWEGGVFGRRGVGVIVGAILKLFEKQEGLSERERKAV